MYFGEDGKKNGRNVHKYQHHQVFSLTFSLLRTVLTTIHYLFIGFVATKIASRVVCQELRGLAHNVKSILSTNVPMEFTRDDSEKFNNAMHCHVCEKTVRARRHASTQSLSFNRAIQRFHAFKLQFKLQRFALHSRSVP